MSIADSFDVISHGSHKTIALSQEHLNQIGSSREISSKLTALMDRGEKDESGRELNLDLRDVQRITSAGLNELIGINSMARSRGFRLVLLDVQEAVREIFALTRLERMFEFRASAIDA